MLAVDFQSYCRAKAIIQRGNHGAPRYGSELNFATEPHPLRHRCGATLQLPTELLLTLSEHRARIHHWTKYLTSYTTSRSPGVTRPAVFPLERVFPDFRKNGVPAAAAAGKVFHVHPTHRCRRHRRPTKLIHSTHWAVWANGAPAVRAATGLEGEVRGATAGVFPKFPRGGQPLTADRERIARQLLRAGAALAQRAAGGGALLARPRRAQRCCKRCLRWARKRNRDGGGVRP